MEYLITDGTKHKWRSTQHESSCSADTTVHRRGVIMSVYAKAMAQKAMEQKQKNFKETGIYETNIQRERREK